MPSLNMEEFGYHGTSASLNKGDLIEPGGGAQVWSRLSSGSHAYYESPTVPSDVPAAEYGNPRRMARDMASGWAASAAESSGGSPHVYFVKALGGHESDPNVGGGAARRAPRLEVMRRATFNPKWDDE